MTRDEMIAAIESEISRLEQVRELLRKSTTGSFGASYLANFASAAPKKRSMSADAKLRIAQAQKRRWAKQRKTASVAESALEKR